MYSAFGIVFDGKIEWNFDNGTDRNVIIFGVHNSSSSHSDNRKNYFLILGDVQLLELMEALVHQRKNLVLILVKRTQNIVWVCIIMLIIVVCLLMEKEYLSLKPTIKTLTLRLNFVSKVYLMDLVLLSLEKYF